MEEAPESKRDLGNQATAQRSESAHKLTKRLYQLATTHSLTDCTPQLVHARNRLIAAQLYCMRYEQSSLKPMAITTPKPAPSRPIVSYLQQPRQRWTLRLVVDERLRVTSLLSSCGLAQQNQAMLLQSHGYQHLYWCISHFLGEPAAERDRPLTTLCVHPSIIIGRRECSKASAATKIALNPFTADPTCAFMRVDAGGGYALVWTT